MYRGGGVQRGRYTRREVYIGGGGVQMGGVHRGCTEGVVYNVNALVGRDLEAVS